MTLESGGRADKQGNRFERMWVVKHLLLIIEGEEYTSFKWEPLGVDGDGVEGFLVDPTCARTYVQCKASAGGTGRWSISSLKPVLEAAKVKLNGDPNAKFVFASAHDAPDLVDLISRSQNCDADPNDFLNHSLASEKLKKVFAALQKVWKHPEGMDGVSRALSLLSRLSVQRMAPEQEGEKEVRSLARRIVEGLPASIVDAVAGIADRALGNTITSETLREELRQGGYRIRSLDGYASCFDAVEQLRERYERSIRPDLLLQRIIRRSVADDLWKAVHSGDATRLFIVHASAGMGKSGVLFDLATRFRDNRIPYLPLRLDRQRPSGTNESFGKGVCGLPGSPARCLHAISGKALAVLLIDQLDALRWTSSHSSDSMDVFIELVEEALAYKNLVVVVACRTFDLSDHPGLENWKRENRSKEYSVGELTDAELKEVLGSYGTTASQLPSRQQAILKTPQNLHLWTCLSPEARSVSAFETPTALMRAYWEDARKKAHDAGIPSTELNVCLDGVVGWMDDQSRLTCPASVVNRHPAARDVLCTLDAIRELGDGVYAFSHQSLFDFLVAEGLFQRFKSAGGSILSWLLAGGQSLFRREQLRLALTLARDEAPRQYLAAIKDIVGSPDVRFHLQDLVFRFLGALDKPSDEECRFAVSLLDDERWKSHVLSHVFRGRPAWFTSLESRGIIDRWLSDSDESRSRIAVDLTVHVVEQFGDSIAGRLEPHLGDSWPWREYIEAIFSRSYPHQESTRMFALRRMLFRSNRLVFKHVFWDELVKVKPCRAIRVLVDLVRDEIRRVMARHDASKAKGRAGPLDRHGWTKLRSAAIRRPKFAWGAVVSLLKSLAPMASELAPKPPGDEEWETKPEVRAAWNQEHSRYFERWNMARNLRRSLEPLLIAAGRRLLRKNPKEFKRLSRGLRLGSIRRTDRCLVLIWAAAPSSRANQAIRWLAATPRRLDAGFRRRYGRLPAAAKLIARLSPVASIETLEVLQSALLRFRDLWALNQFKWHLETKSHQWSWPNSVGEISHWLLHQIPAASLTPESCRRLDELDRKYGRRPRPALKRSHGLGWVRSSIPHERLHRVPDSQWLKIMAKDWAPRRGPWKEAIGGYREASHEMFSRDLGIAASWQPSRFADFAIRIPKKTHACYLGSILWSLSSREPENLPAELKDAWAPAMDSQVLAVLAHVGFSQDREIGVGTCRLARGLSLVDVPEDLRACIARYAAEHADPQDEVELKRADAKEQKGSVGAIEFQAINCVRGVAFGTIGRWLREDSSAFEGYLPALLSGCSDSVLAVRAAAIEATTPLLENHSEVALELFRLATADCDPLLLGTHQVTRFLVRAMPKHADWVEPACRTMIRCRDEHLSTLGADLATQAYLRFGCLRTLFDTCTTCASHLKAGAAEAAAHILGKRPARGDAFDLVVRFFNDDDFMVRSNASNVLRYKGILDAPIGLDLARAFVASASFRTHAENLVDALTEEVAALEDFADVILKGCERAAEPGHPRDDYEDKQLAAFHGLPPVVFRLYERTKDRADPTLHGKCLDIWDHFLRMRIWNADKVLREL